MMRRIRANIYYWPEETAGLGHVWMDLFEVDQPSECEEFEHCIRVEMPEVLLDEKKWEDLRKFNKKKESAERTARWFDGTNSYNLISENCAHEVERQLFLAGYLSELPALDLKLKNDDWKKYHQEANQQLKQQKRHRWALTPWKIAQEAVHLGIKKVEDEHQQISNQLKKHLEAKQAKSEDTVTLIRKLLYQDIQLLKLKLHYKLSDTFDEKVQDAITHETRTLDDILQINETSEFIQALKQTALNKDIAISRAIRQKLMHYSNALLTAQTDVYLEKETQATTPTQREIHDKSLASAFAKANLPLPRVFVNSEKLNTTISFHYKSYDARQNFYQLFPNTLFREFCFEELKIFHGHETRPQLLLITMPQQFIQAGISPEKYINTLMTIAAQKHILTSEASTVVGTKLVIKQAKIVELNIILNKLLKPEKNDDFHNILWNTRNNKQLNRTQFWGKSRTEEMFDILCEKDSVDEKKNGVTADHFC